MKVREWIKTAFTAFLLHIILIVISIIEVFFYSLLIVPGKDEAFYSKHAEASGPWVSGIFGSIFIFLLVRRFIKRHDQHHLIYTIALPGIYIALDAAFLMAYGVDWSEHILVTGLANSVKVLSAFISYSIFKPR